MAKSAEAASSSSAKRTSGPKTKASADKDKKPDKKKGLAGRIKPRSKAAARRRSGASGASRRKVALGGAAGGGSRNSLRTRLLQDKEALCCCFLMSASPVMAEIVARVYPVVLLDFEHGSGSMGMDLIHLLQAVRSGGAEALVRVPKLSNDDITKALDAGAAGVVVPLVESAEEAKAALAAARYPPKGRRGVAPGCVRASGWGLEGGYTGRADGDALILAQVETKKAMQEDVLNGILSSGIDGIFLGPNDLSASVGHLGNVDHPQVVALRERLEKTCAAKGVMLTGFAAGRRASASDMLQKRGYRLVATTTDVTLMREAAVANLKASTASGRPSGRPGRPGRSGSRKKD